jgi:hypothetical protein
MDNFSSIFIIDYNIIEQGEVLLFLNLYTNKDLEREDVYKNILLQTREIY